LNGCIDSYISISISISISNYVDIIQALLKGKSSTTISQDIFLIGCTYNVLVHLSHVMLWTIGSRVLVDNFS